MPLFRKPDVSKLEQKRDIKEIIKALKHRDERIRRQAAEALGRIDEEAIDPLLQEIRKPPYNETPTGVVVALAQIGTPVVEPLIRAQARATREGNVLLLTKTAVITGHVLRQVGEPAVDPLIRILTDPDTNVRGLVSAALGTIGEPAVEPLLNALTEPRDEGRIGAAVALGLICDRRAIEPLKKALEDDNRWVRLHSAGALTKTDPSETQAIQLLKEAIQDYGSDSSNDYREVAALYLKQISSA